MFGMYPMMGMGSNGLGVAGGGGMGQGQLDPRTLMMISAMSGAGGGGASPLAGGPINAPIGAMSPMSNYIGARPSIAGNMPGGGGMPPVVGGGMPGPAMGAPGGLPQPGAGGAMDISSMLKTPAGLTALLASLKGNQEGLAPSGGQQPTGGIPPAPPGAPPGLSSPTYTQGFGAALAPGAAPSQPGGDWGAQPDFLQRLMAMFSPGPKY